MAWCSGQEMNGGETVLVSIAKRGAVSSVAFLADGSRFVSGGEDESGTIQEWRTDTGHKVGEAIKAGSSVNAIAVSRDGKWIVGGTDSGLGIVWDAQTHRKVVSMNAHKYWVRTVDISPDSTRVATGSGDDTVIIWSIFTGEPLLDPLIHDNDVLTVKFSPTGDRIATATLAYPSIRIYDSSTGSKLIDVPIQTSSDHGKPNAPLAWSSDGQQIFALSNHELVCIHTSTGTVLSRWQVASGSSDPLSIALTHSGKIIMSSTGPSVTFWDIVTGTQIGPDFEQPAPVWCMTLAHDDCYLAIGREDKKIALLSLHDDFPEVYNSINCSFMHIGRAGLESLMQDDFTTAETIFTRDIMRFSKYSHHALAHRALVWARLRKWDAAHDDARKSIEAHPSVIGHIALAISLVGKGDGTAARRAFDLVFRDGNPNDNKFLLLLKSIVLFTEDPDDAIYRANDLIDSVDDELVCLSVLAYMHILNGKAHMENGDYEHAIESFECALTHNSLQNSQLDVITLIFGWRFDKLSMMAQRHLCEALLALGHMSKAARALKNLVGAFHDEIRANNEMVAWIFTMFESIGDIEWKFERHNEAITHYATALSLDLPVPQSFLLKWVKAALGAGSWKGVLSDGTEFGIPFLRMYRAICEVLEESGHVGEASDCFIHMMTACEGGMNLMRSDEADWATAFKEHHAEELGDAAMNSQNYSEAVTYFGIGLTVISLDAQAVQPLVRKWINAKLMAGSWMDAVSSADEVSRIAIYQAICDVLAAADRVAEAIEWFLKVKGSIRGVMTDEQTAWASDFKHRFAAELGDTAMKVERFDDAIDYYSVAMSQNPSPSPGLLLKRSKARASKQLWDDALNDANQVIALEPDSPWGYDSKRIALHGAGRYEDAIDIYKTMLSTLHQSSDPGARELLSKYVEPSTTETTIRRVVAQVIRPLPRVLINTNTGRLHDKAMQAAAFEALPIFKELVTSTTTHLDVPIIEKTVRDFYRYVTLSHKWEQNEPLFQGVSNVPVYQLKSSRETKKLIGFCSLVRDAGFHWAWSDTCCIDQKDQIILQEALVAMFSWYRGSSITIVYLRGVRSRSQRRGDLRRSIWNTRAWTFQEYIAAEAVQFYTEDWTPYLNLTISNHKDAVDVISEMEQATGFSEERLSALSPGLDRVRDKLYMASMRETTKVEDMAYSLFGIFNVALTVIYGEGNRAVGRLLEHILTGSGDVTVLAWTGISGSYNSCLPADMSAYSQPATTHIPSPIDSTEMDKKVTELRILLGSPAVALRLYDRLHELPAPSMVASRLRLPVIVFQVDKLVLVSAATHVYRVTVSTLGEVEIKTAETLTGMKDLLLVHPWVSSLLDWEFSQGAATLDRTTQALRLVALLGQPFGALLVAKQGRVDHRRVASDSMIMVQIRTDASLADLLNCIRTIDIQ